MNDIYRCKISAQLQILIKYNTSHLTNDYGRAQVIILNKIRRPLNERDEYDDIEPKSRTN